MCASVCRCTAITLAPMGHNLMTRFAAPISEAIWDMKYRLKSAEGAPLDATIDDTWTRIADALAAAEADPAHWAPKFRAALQDFRFLPAGRIVAGAGTGRAVTLFNCFVMGTIPDSMGGIFNGDMTAVYDRLQAVRGTDRYSHVSENGRPASLWRGL